MLSENHTQLKLKKRGDYNIQRIQYLQNSSRIIVLRHMKDIDLITMFCLCETYSHVNKFG